MLSIKFPVSKNGYPRGFDLAISRLLVKDSITQPLQIWICNNHAALCLFKNVIPIGAEIRFSLRIFNLSLWRLLNQYQLKLTFVTRFFISLKKVIDACITNFFTCKINCLNTAPDPRFPIILPLQAKKKKLWIL